MQRSIFWWGVVACFAEGLQPFYLPLAVDEGKKQDSNRCTNALHYQQNTPTIISREPLPRQQHADALAAPAAAGVAQGGRQRQEQRGVRDRAGAERGDHRGEEERQVEHADRRVGQQREDALQAGDEARREQNEQPRAVPSREQGGEVALQAGEVPEQEAQGGSEEALFLRRPGEQEVGRGLLRFCCGHWSHCVARGKTACASCGCIYVLKSPSNLVANTHGFPPEQKQRGRGDQAWGGKNDHLVLQAEQEFGVISWAKRRGSVALRGIRAEINFHEGSSVPMLHLKQAAPGRRPHERPGGGQGGEESEG